MTSSKTSTGCSACPVGKTSDAGVGKICDKCTAGYSGSWESHPDLLTLIDASKTTSTSFSDLKGTDMSWGVGAGQGVTRYGISRTLRLWNLKSYSHILLFCFAIKQDVYFREKQPSVSSGSVFLLALQ